MVQHNYIICRTMPYKNKEKNREYQRNWARNNRKTLNEWTRNLRLKVIVHLGGKCVYCGCDDPKALEVNHKNGGGNQERKKKGKKAWYSDIINDRHDNSTIELTCRVCNSWHYLVKVKGIEDRWTITYNKRTSSPWWTNSTDDLPI